MLTVTKTVIHFPDGTKMVDKNHFPVKDIAALEKRRRQDRSRYGAERVNYNYYENEGEDEESEREN